MQPSISCCNVCVCGTGWRLTTKPVSGFPVIETLKMVEKTFQMKNHGIWKNKGTEIIGIFAGYWLCKATFCILQTHTTQVSQILVKCKRFLHPHRKKMWCFDMSHSPNIHAFTKCHSLLKQVKYCFGVIANHNHVIRRYRSCINSMACESMTSYHAILMRV